MRKKWKKYLYNLFCGDYRDHPRLRDWECSKAEKMLYTAAEEFSQKLTDDKIKDAFWNLEEYVSALEVETQRVAFYEGMQHGAKIVMALTDE